MGGALTGSSTSNVGTSALFGERLLTSFIMIAMSYFDISVMPDSDMWEVN
jgi:hypothetical protein